MFAGEIQGAAPQLRGSGVVARPLAVGGGLLNLLPDELGVRPAGAFEDARVVDRGRDDLGVVLRIGGHGKRGNSRLNRHHCIAAQRPRLLEAPPTLEAPPSLRLSQDLRKASCPGSAGILPATGRRPRDGSSGQGARAPRNGITCLVGPRRSPARIPRIPEVTSRRTHSVRRINRARNGHERNRSTHRRRASDRRSEAPARVRGLWDGSGADLALANRRRVQTLAPRAIRGGGTRCPHRRGRQRHRTIPQSRKGGAHRLPHRYATDRRMARRRDGRDLRTGGRTGVVRGVGDEGLRGRRRVLARRGRTVLRLLRESLVRGRDAGARARRTGHDRRHGPHSGRCAQGRRTRRGCAGASRPGSPHRLPRSAHRTGALPRGSRGTESELSPALSERATSSSNSRASRTTPAPPRWLGAGTRRTRWSNSRTRSFANSRPRQESDRCGRSGR